MKEKNIFLIYLTIYLLKLLLLNTNIASSYADPTVDVPAILAPVRSDFLTPMLDMGLSLPPENNLISGLLQYT